MLDELTDSAAIEKDYDSLVDSTEREILNLEPVEIIIEHQFVPGMYIRTIYIPANSLLTSLTHKTEHPFVIRSGLIEVRLKDRIDLFKSGHLGITYPGTRRVLFAIEDTVWSTFHVTTETNVSKIEAMILEPHKNKELFDEIKKQGRAIVRNPLLEGVN